MDFTLPFKKRYCGFTVSGVLQRRSVYPPYRYRLRHDKRGCGRKRRLYGFCAGETGFFAKRGDMRGDFRWEGLHGGIVPLP